MKQEIIYKSVKELVPYAMNSRTHSDEQVAQIMASIKEFGFTNPILTDGDNGVIAGHGRLMATQRLGIEEVPTIELSHLTEAQKKAYIIADNKLALNSSWDEDFLKMEMKVLSELDINLDVIGFSFDELEDIFNEEEENIDEEYIEEKELKEQDYKEAFSIIIDCDSELHQEELFYNLTNQGLKCRVQSL